MPLTSPWLVKTMPGGGDVAWCYVPPGGDPTWECAPWFCAGGLQTEYPTLPWDRIKKVRLSVAVSDPEEPGWQAVVMERDEDACFRAARIHEDGYGFFHDLHNAVTEFALEALGEAPDDAMRVEEEPCQWDLWIRWEAVS